MSIVLVDVTKFFRKIYSIYLRNLIKAEHFYFMAISFASHATWWFTFDCSKATLKIYEKYVYGWGKYDKVRLMVANRQASSFYEATNADEETSGLNEALPENEVDVAIWRGRPIL